MSHHSKREHYQKKYPRGRVHATEQAVDVFDAVGNHCVAVRLSGAGIWVDASEEYGCKHRHCMAPLSDVVEAGRVLSTTEAAARLKAEAKKAAGESKAE